MPRRLDYAHATMPALLREIARLTSPAHAVKFARRFGGRALYIPRAMSSMHPIAGAVGFTAAEMIAAAMGGSEIQVPSAATYLRYLDARALRLLGVPNDEAARLLRIGERHYRRLLTGFDPAEYEIDAAVRAVGRLYGVKPDPARLASNGNESAQLSWDFPEDRGGMRYRAA